MSWHLGYPLSQTLFTSFYVEALSMPEPRSIEEATFVRNGTQDPNEQLMLQVLRAYCLGMLKSCGYVNERIKSEHYYEVSLPNHGNNNDSLLLNSTLNSGRRFCHHHI